MNTKKHMMIIKGEIRTADVQSCQYNRETKKWDVKYKDGKTYNYSYANVEWLKEPEVMNVNMYRISKVGQEFYNIDEIYVFHSTHNSYWHLCFGDGSERDYLQSELNIEKSCFTETQAKNVFEYLKQISHLSDIKNEETGEKLLPKRYEKIDFVGNNIALSKYINPGNVEKINKKREVIPIFPFGCNKSQYKAVKNALENQISVIQGPPGTGKTQTILNIIANVLMEGKTVLIVSNNNSATENVYEKLSLPKYNLSFMVASLGKTENKKAFIIEQQAVYPDFASWKLKENDNITLVGIRDKSRQLNLVFEKQEELALLKQELSQLEVEVQYFKQYLSETDVVIDSVKIKKKITSKEWMLLWHQCQLVSERKNKLSLLFKLKSIFLYGIFDLDFYKQDLSKIITTFQGMYYKQKHKELTDDILKIEEYLHGVDNTLLDDMCSQSMAILRDTLARKYEVKGHREIFTEDDLWKKSSKVLDEYPIILSTTFSSRNSLSNEIVYDYLIMDEASQVDVATGALALSCARNAVIVGDTKQLPNVVKEDTKKVAQSIFDTFKINEGYRFTNSFLQSVLDVMPEVTQTLLKEHYRCHPKIINFCNQKFYRGELVIMTQDKGEKDVLAVIKTVEGNHARNHYSQRQIDVIKNEIMPKFVDNVEETGIIAPYKNQVEALEKEFTDIDVATVHKFQGKEKDAIIISTVDDEISDFVDDPYLLNVAVSRAKKRLMLVVSGNEQAPERNISDLISYIQYNNFEVMESKIYSIFDYLYKQYTVSRQEFLKKNKKISEYDSENLMYALITEILKSNEFACLDVVCQLPLNMIIKNLELLNERECDYVMNPATSLDFVIYNRIAKTYVLGVEVDGYGYHKDGVVQAERDVMKNHILDLYKLPLVRFKTNGSSEKEILIEKLTELVK